MPNQIHAPSAPPSTVPFPAPSVGWYATIVLAFLYWLSILDRFIISLLVEPIKRDMGISDLQFGLLHGMAFAITYSLFGLVAGAMADRFSRRWIIFASVSIWSFATAACGAAVQYWQLLIARVGVGAGEAGLNPSATSMLTDLFPRDKLTSALAVYTIGATVGSGTAYFFGGMIVEAVATTPSYIIPLLGEIRSWQAVFLFIGIPGIAISFIVFTFPEPFRRDRRTNEVKQNFWAGIFASYANLLRFICSQKRFFAHHYAGFALGSMVMSGCAIWYPAHMGRTFGWGAGEIGLWLGSVVVISSISGKLLCGYFVDKMYKRGYRDAQFRWYASCLILSAPIGVFMMTTDSPILFLAGASLFLSLMAPLPACYTASLNLATPNELRGTGMAFFAGTAGLIGMAAGPVLIATASEQLYGEGSIGLGMATVIGIFCPLSALILATGCKAMRKAVNDLEQAS
ncbi:MFS transporter [Zhongshania aquimaris]|uniref:MFS transporter n=1 Tax=Zhongshania aquimaris TaxID=2857107 RepID=A0ABS6VVU4_9GAMM|nr:MFS transporter [Zhongshania aquimaris]MBW2942471.1 MFS transporter [Zhongshania aquimaris]